MSTSIRIVFLFIFLAACNQAESRAEKERKNLKTSLALVDVVWNNKDLSRLDTFFTDEFTREVNSIENSTDLIELTAVFNIYFTGFPNLHFTVEQMTPVDDQIFMKWNITGTNTGTFGDYPPTGKKIKINGLTRLDFNSENKIVRQTIFYTELSLLQQLGYELNKPETKQISIN